MRGEGGAYPCNEIPVSPLGVERSFEPWGERKVEGCDGSSERQKEREKERKGYGYARQANSLTRRGRVK